MSGVDLDRLREKVAQRDVVELFADEAAALLSEVERGRKALELVERLIDHPAEDGFAALDSDEESICFFCRNTWPREDGHMPDCAWVDARALLAEARSLTEEAGE